MTTTGEVLKPCISEREAFADFIINELGPYQIEGISLIDAAEKAWKAALAWIAPQGNAAQEGYVLVPVEITDEMEQAIFSELGSPSDWHGFKEAYRAMIAAAPSNKEVER